MHLDLTSVNSIKSTFFHNMHKANLFIRFAHRLPFVWFEVLCFKEAVYIHTHTREAAS